MVRPLTGQYAQSGYTFARGETVGDDFAEYTDTECGSGICGSLPFKSYEGEKFQYYQSHNPSQHKIIMSVYNGIAHSTATDTATGTATATTGTSTPKTTGIPPTATATPTGALASTSTTPTPTPTVTSAATARLRRRRPRRQHPHLLQSVSRRSRYCR
jgi:hypothetical protein